MKHTRTIPHEVTVHDAASSGRFVRWLAVAGALACIVALTAPAAAQLSSTSSGTGGSTCGGGNDGNGFCGFSSQQLVDDGTTFQSRYAWNINADIAPLSTKDINSSAQHNLSFNATAPGSYRLDISTNRVGMLQRNADVSNCDAQAHTSGITGSSNIALNSGTLSLGSPGDIGNGGGDNQIPFNQSSGNAVIGPRASGGTPQGHSLTFTWNGSVRSNSCEAAVRQGQQNGSTTDCGACEYPGSPSRTLENDGHFVTVTFTSFCGNGMIDGTGEQCDGGVCCNTNCTFRSTATVCRSAADICDVAENCSGSSANCPANGFASSSTVCRAVGGVCDVAESCTGSGAACPPDALLGTSTVCRPASGICDEPENCTGTIPVCPLNSFAPPSTVCRGSAGICDVAENCTGSGATCPSNGFASSATVCRGSGGMCDIAETCTGSGATCPSDTKSTAQCRGAADVCDAAESCDGVTDDCPFDLPLSAGTPCRGVAGVCDVAESCDGGSIACPADAKSTAECRGVAGECDVAESCDGVGNDCPADQFQPATLECRATAGVCDVAENCDGGSATCPADAFVPASTVCRADAGDCDIADTCTGSSADCPADALETDGTGCNDANACTLSDMCVAGQCIGDSENCGDGVEQGGCGEECDDGNQDAGDGCSPTCLIEPGLACTDGPLPDCRRPFISGKSSLQIQKGKTTAEKDLIKWKWLKGERTTLIEWGNPLTTTNYQVCIYDQTGLRFEITHPAGGTCDGKPCWKATGTSGFKYKDKLRDPDGGEKLQLKAGAIGKAKIQMLARGPLLGVGDVTTLMQPITVQIQQSSGDQLCWEAIYSDPPTLLTPIKFKDKAD